MEVAQHVLQWTENIIDVNHAFLDGREAHKLPSGYIDPDPAAQLDEVRVALVDLERRGLVEHCDGRWRRPAASSSDIPC